MTLRSSFLFFTTASHHIAFAAAIVGLQPYRSRHLIMRDSAAYLPTFAAS